MRRFMFGLFAWGLAWLPLSALAQSVPNAPSNVRVGVTRIVTGVGESQSYLIRWQDNSLNENYFMLQVRVGLVGPFTSLTSALVGPDTEATTVPLSVAFPAGTLLQWRVVAVKDPTVNALLSGDETYSSPSPAGSVTIPAQLSFDAPDSFAVSVTGDGLLQFSWRDRSTTEEAFEIQSKVSTASDATYTTLLRPAFEQNPLSAPAGLLPGQSYTLRIRALRAGTVVGENVVYSQSTSFSAPVTISIPALSPPTGLQVTTLAENLVRLQWEDNSYNEGDFKYTGQALGGYVVLRRPAGVGSYGELGTVSANVERVENVHVIPGRSFDWQVKARHRNGSSVVDSAVSNTATMATPFHAPTGLVAVLSGATSVNLSWKDNSSVETGYIVEGRTLSSGTFVTLSYLPGNAQSTTLDIEPGETTELRVKAYYAFDGQEYPSAPTATVSLTTTNGFVSKPNHHGIKGNSMIPYQAQVGNAPARTSWEMLSGPAWASFNSATGQITGTPSESGLFPVRLSATFMDGNTSELEVTIRVEEQPQAPVANGAPTALTIPVGTPISLPLHYFFSDLDSPSAVRVNTSEGSFSIILQNDITPKTVANFMTYVNAGDYTGVAVHRAPRVGGTPFVVQTGGYKPTSDPSPNNQFNIVTKRTPVPNEPGIPNLRGTVSMAKSPGDPDSATSEFFVSMRDNRSILDDQNGGFTVFGRVPEVDMGVLDILFGPAYHIDDVSIQTPLGTGWLRRVMDDWPLRGSSNPLTAESDGVKPVYKTNLISLHSVTSQAVLRFEDLNSTDPSSVEASLSGSVLTLTGLMDGTSSTVSFQVIDLDGQITNHSILVSCDVDMNPPAIQTHPSGQTLSPGGSHTLSVSATGDTLSYQWLKNGKPIPGAALATYQITNAQLSDDAVYQLLVSNAAGMVPSNSVTVRVHTPPTIITDPISITRPFEGRASFSVKAAGSPEGFSYQWRKNGNPITGATSATYTIPFLSMTDAAEYTCRVTNDFGHATSAAAVLTVQPYDRDNDGLPDHEELARGTDRFNADTDGDGYSDGMEVTYSSDPKSSTSTPASNIVSAKVERIAQLGAIPMRPLPARTGFPNGLGTPATLNIPQMWLSTHEITNAQFAAMLQHARDHMSSVISIVDNAGQQEVHSRGNLICRLPTHKRTDPGNLDVDEVTLSEQGDTFLVPRVVANHPVRGVTWYAAYLAAEVMNHFYGYNSKMDLPNTSFNFPDFGFHIPRFAEWEYAARSGSTTQPFATGTSISGTRANYAASSFGKPKPVNSHAANAVFGCFNLSGNVSEWVFEEDPALSGNSFTRGGGYDDAEADLRTDARTSRPRNAVHASAGIRLALVDTRAPSSPVPPSPYVIAATGSPITLTAGATGAPPLSWQWFKDNKPLAGKTSATLTIPAAALADGGTYKAVATNALGSVTTDSSVVTVVDAAPRTLYVKMGASVTLPAVTKGSTILAHDWLKDDEDLPEAPGLYEGTGSAKLKVTGPTERFSGIYRCLVTGPGLSGTVSSGPVHVIFVEKPLLGNIQSFQPVTVGGQFSLTPLYDPVQYRTPTRWSITGLPPGLSFNPATGAITGRAAKSGVFNVSVTAHNVAGSSNTVVYRIPIQAFPAGSIGDFVGRILPGTAPAQDDLGGRIDLKTTSAGTFTGNVVLEGVRYPIKGTLNADPIASDFAASSAKSRITLNVTRPNLPTIQLALVLDPAIQGLGGTVGPIISPATAPATGSTVLINGWRNTWSGSTTSSQNLRAGTQTLHLELPATEANKPEAPQGAGFATLSVALKGATQVIGKAADGTAITSAGWLAPNGDVLLFSAPYAAKGTLLGLLNVNSNTNRDVTGTIRWLKKDLGATSTERNYKAGFGPYNLAASGRAYIPPAIGQMLAAFPGGTNNAKITFSPLKLNTGGTALEGSENAIFTLNTNHTTTLPAATATLTVLSLKFIPGTGLFSGRVRLVDGSDTREAPFEGILVRNAVNNTPGLGLGHVLLPHLPVSPTSPLLSSLVRIEKNP